MVVPPTRALEVLWYLPLPSQATVRTPLLKYLQGTGSAILGSRAYSRLTYQLWIKSFVLPSHNFLLRAVEILRWDNNF